METYALLLAATLQAGTVLALAALGLLINEKAGVVNLGAEGMMLCAAIAGFATVVHTGSDALGFAAGMLAGALMAAVFGALVVGLNTNPYATGLALSLLGTGLSAFVGVSYVQAKVPERQSYAVPWLSDVPWLGDALFKHHPMVYAVIGLTLFLMWWFEHTRTGLVLRAVGESPQSAHALGHPVRRIRMAAVIAGGALCGLSGAYLSIIYTPLWVEGMVAGKGWIALALTAVSPASQWLGNTQPVFEHVALSGHHCGAGLDFEKPHLDQSQYAGLAWQILHTGLIMPLVFFRSSKEIS